MKTRLRRLAVLACVVSAAAVSVRAQAATILVTANIVADEVWTSDSAHILTTVIYVTNGATLTIELGRVSNLIGPRMGISLTTRRAMSPDTFLPAQVVLSCAVASISE